MLARQRVRDLGIYKAIGMTPRQVVATIVAWVLMPALAAALVALPAGIVIEHAVAQMTVNGQTSGFAQVVPPGVGPAGGPRSRSSTARAAPPRVVRYRPTGRKGRQRVIEQPAGVSRAPGPGGPSPGPGPPTADVGVPPAYNPGTIVLLVLAGVMVAIGGALAPASWAAFSKSDTVLHAE